MRNPKRLDFKSFMEGEMVRVDRDNRVVKSVIVGAGAITLMVIGADLVLSVEGVSAAETLSDIQTDNTNAFDNLIKGLFTILDPAAKVFGVIAGLAIMTGNGKIGLERLFWLSLGYITARKVEVWIDWLNTI